MRQKVLDCKAIGHKKEEVKKGPSRARTQFVTVFNRRLKKTEWSLIQVKGEKTYCSVGGGKQSQGDPV